jgi:SAM-dependent methyltransferase
MGYFDCWQSKKHADLFDYRDFFPSFRLAGVYSNFNEFNLFRKSVNRDFQGTLLEVGCATGASYRLFGRFFKNIHYAGVDISECALIQARLKYPRGNFISVDSELSQLKGKKFDFVFCRDVVLHQTKPFEFLSKLAACSPKGIFLRLRTRDKGATELDVEKSCQLNYGVWAPYIIINSDELIAYFKKMPGCARIVLNKNYKVLGGVHSRYLPKDCYLPETGTAETSVYVEFNDGGVKGTQVSVETKKDALNFSLPDRVLNKAVQLLTGSRINSKIWW